MQLTTVDKKFKLLEGSPVLEDVEIENDESTTLISMGQALNTKDTSEIKTMFGYFAEGATE